MKWHKVNQTTLIKNHKSANFQTENYTAKIAHDRKLIQAQQC